MNVLTNKPAKQNMQHLNNVGLRGTLLLSSLTSNNKRWRMILLPFFYKESAMDPNMLGHMLMTFIEVSYKGGLQQFTEDGGLISSIPFGDNTALIYLKDPPDDFVAAIEEFNERRGCQVKFASDFNFENENTSDVIHKLSDALKDIAERFSIRHVLVNPANSLVLYINFPEADLSEEDISEISSILVSRIKSLVRGVLTINGEHYPFDNSGVGKITKEEDSIDFEPIESNKQAITEDSITDLKIALGNAQTVEDFLKMI
jgi:hypothetical protein